jgi:murein DD-endopeptidase MepM/ murein hydrolase activator NlpD
MGEELKSVPTGPEIEPSETGLPEEGAREENSGPPVSRQSEPAPKATRLGNLAVRAGLGILLVAVVGLLAYMVWQPARSGTAPPASGPATTGQQPGSQAANSSSVELQPFATPMASSEDGIHRLIQPLTAFPDRPRVSVITYTVQTGDNLFAIADNFGLKAETLLWSNFQVLKDNPHMLSTKQVLFIPPVNGAYYQWKEGDTLEGVASFYQVDLQAIFDYPGNHFDLTKSSKEAYGLKPDDWIIIPGGKRPIKDWGPPAISRSNPAAARYYGDGYCGKVYQGAIGTGTFIWPTVSHVISGYNYSSIHPAIDIGGALGSPIVASDSGVVVFAGWSNFGYGYLIVIDHGNGFQTAYAHLSAIAVGCGQSVFQGSYIGALGSTGNSTGPHCHFEISYNGAKPNPLDYLP